MYTKYTYADTTTDVNDADEIRNRAEQIFTSSKYKKQVEHSKKNWLDLSVYISTILFNYDIMHMEIRNFLEYGFRRR